MSAFVVDKPHIDALVRCGLAYTRDSIRWLYQGKVRELTYNTADEVGRMLLEENLNSVRHRYPGDEDDLPGPVEHYWGEPYVYPLFGRNPTPVEGLKLLDCYEYQSCEHPGWRESEAYAYVLTVRALLIRHLPGYAEAPWELKR